MTVNLGQALPVGDWQFWVVTVVTVLILLFAVRNYIPGLRKAKTTRVQLTIDRNRPNRDKTHTPK